LPQLRAAGVRVLRLSKSGLLIEFSPEQYDSVTVATTARNDGAWTSSLDATTSPGQDGLHQLDAVLNAPQFEVAITDQTGD